MKTERTRLRRMAKRGHHDKVTLHALLDALPLAHIGYVDAFGKPAVIPTLQWREGNHIYWHASNGARSLKAMDGAEICLTVSILDGFVMAKSALHHSANYRSVMIYGKASKVPDTLKEEKLKGMFDALYPGRWEKLRPISKIELKQTAVFSLPLEEASVKIRAAGVSDDEEDLSWPLWTGVVPIHTHIGTPIDDENNHTDTPIGDDIRAIKLG